MDVPDPSAGPGTITAPPPAGSACAGRRPGRPRSEACRLAILDAAWRILAAGGIAAFTIERVAATAGVGRTTIYRWWPSRGALAVGCLLETVQHRFQAAPAAAGQPLLERHLAQVLAVLRSDAGRIIAGILAEAQADRDTQAAFEAGYLQPRRQELARQLRQAIDTGEMPRTLDLEIACDLLIGGLLLRLLSGEMPDDPALPRRMLDSLRSGAPHAADPRP